MDIQLENEIPISAEELWRTLHTPDFDDFIAKRISLFYKSFTIKKDIP
jgi:hypothetical protein